MSLTHGVIWMALVPALDIWCFGCYLGGDCQPVGDPGRTPGKSAGDQRSVPVVVRKNGDTDTASTVSAATSSTCRCLALVLGKSWSTDGDSGSFTLDWQDQWSATPIEGVTWNCELVVAGKSGGL